MDSTILECSYCITKLNINSIYCHHCGMKLKNEQLNISKEKLNIELYAIDLWNKYDTVSERCRFSKQTAKSIGNAVSERAEIEDNYAKSLIKIINKYNINEPDSSYFITNFFN